MSSDIDARRADVMAVNTVRSLLRLHWKKLGMRDGEFRSLDRSLEQASDTLALVMGSEEARRIVSVRPS